MNIPGSADYSHEHLAQDLMPELESRKQKVLRDVATLLQSGGVEDETDRGIVEAAAAFLEKPTENLSEIMSHTSNIGAVFGGYEMMGMDIPPALDAMYACLLALQCINRINFVEGEIEKGSALISPEIQDAMAMALDRATAFSRAYKDGALLAAVNQLQERLKGLTTLRLI